MASEGIQQENGTDKTDWSDENMLMESREL